MEMSETMNFGGGMKRSENKDLDGEMEMSEKEILVEGWK